MGWTDQTSRLRTRGLMEQDNSISAPAPLLQFKLCKGQTVVFFSSGMIYDCQHLLLHFALVSVLSITFYVIHL